MKEKMLYKAIKIAEKAHRKQTDKFGAPYLGHVMRVMNAGKTLNEKIVGVLHDVIEDCPELTLEDLRDEGFSEEIIFAIDCLTKTDDLLNYDVFIEKVEQSPLAIAVKINDLRDNMDLTRFGSLITERDHKRLNKYLKAYQYLTENY